MPKRRNWFARTSRSVEISSKNSRWVVETVFEATLRLLVFLMCTIRRRISPFLRNDEQCRREIVFLPRSRRETQSRRSSICSQIETTKFFSPSHSVVKQEKARRKNDHRRWQWLFPRYFSSTTRLWASILLIWAIMFWILYMLFSIFRSHRNRFYWRNGKLHIVKAEQLRLEGQPSRLTAAQQEKIFRRDLRQWAIFYSMLVCLIVALLIHRLHTNRQMPKQWTPLDHLHVLFPWLLNKLQSLTFQGHSPRCWKDKRCLGRLLGREKK